MTVLRSDIEKALDDLISNEEGMRFQGLAVVLAKQRWPDLVASERLGVALLTQPSAAGFHADGVIVKPLSDTSLCFNTCVILRADNASRLIEEYVRMFLRRHSSQRLPPEQVELSSSAQVLGWKTSTPPSRP